MVSLKWFSLLTIVASCLQIQISSAASSDQTNEYWTEARAQYVDALKLLARGRTTQFIQLKSQLKDYPLYPYLEYAHLRVKMKRRTPSKSVADFLNTYKDTPLAPQLKHRWLRTLARRGQWQRYLQFYDDQIRSTELQCYALWARYKTGDADQAIEQAQHLWLVGKSQPKACDPIFKVWRESGRLTDELLWQRFSLAMKARKTQLARYLIRYMSTEQQKLAKLYRELHFYPDRIQRRRFATLDAKREEILLHSIKRLAGKDALLAKTLWSKFSKEHGFSGSLKQQIDFRIILKLAKQNHNAAYVDALSSYPYPDDTSLIAAGIDMAIRQQDWPTVIGDIKRLPDPTQKLARWQYWLARAALQSAPDDAIDSKAIYTSLSGTRDYYGFLAADYLDVEYQLNAKSYAIEGNHLEQIKLLPGVIRARELFLTGNNTEARREWAWATRSFDAEKYYASAHYAYELGWHSQAIRSAIDSERWHDLKLRFPLAYTEQMVAAAKSHQINSNWLLALARQESAMVSDAQSPKGAMGLMQIMPATAKMVSKKHKIRYASSFELLNPDKSVELASAYLKELLTKFNGNSIYASAAYNAGPHRVNRWLKDTANQPLDIWIENIPFSETRQYVKNVLAYSVIFAKLRQQEGFHMATKQYLSNISPQLAIKTIEPE